MSIVMKFVIKIVIKKLQDQNVGVSWVSQLRQQKHDQQIHDSGLQPSTRLWSAVEPAGCDPDATNLPTICGYYFDIIHAYLNMITQMLGIFTQIMEVL